MTPNQFGHAVTMARRTLPHGQRPTSNHVKIAWLLARWQNPNPPHAKLARAANVHRNTVGNALHRFRALGLLTWQRQVIRLGGGWVAQIANRYFFPEQPSLPLPKPLATANKTKKDSIFSCPTNFVQRGRSAVSVASSEPEAARRALQQVREARQRALGLA
jgi:DNA-binding transcriptional MocR family regulator